MRVILLADVERLGHEGDIVEVRKGYGRNYLLPRGMATPATPGALRDLELRREAIERRNLEKREAALAVADSIQGRPIVIRRMVGERGRLHGRVTTTQIAEAIAEQMRLPVDRRDIHLREPIKAVGDYVISARLFRDVAVDLTVRVAPLASEEEDAAAHVPTSAEAAAGEEAVEAEGAIEEVEQAKAGADGGEHGEALDAGEAEEVATEEPDDEDDPGVAPTTRHEEEGEDKDDTE